MCLGRVCIQTSGTIKLSKVASTSTAIGQRDRALVHTVKGLVNYAGPFKCEYCVKFLHERTKDIVDETLPSGCLRTRSCGTYNRYLCFAKLVIKKKEIVDLLRALSSENTCGKSLGISHADSPVLYVMDPDYAILLVKEAEFYVINSAKTAPFHGRRFIALPEPYWWNLITFIANMPSTCIHRLCHL